MTGTRIKIRWQFSRTVVAIGLAVIAGLAAACIAGLVWMWP